MIRTGTAHWHGDLKSGAGVVGTESGVLASTPYSFTSRFEAGKGTNPEELLAAAHAGCFTMALSLQLQQAGFTADSLDTTCSITLDRVDGAFAITHSKLTLKAKVPNISKEDFDKATQAAKEGCPVSKLYKAEISLEATLE